MRNYEFYYYLFILDKRKNLKDNFDDFINFINEDFSSVNFSDIIQIISFIRDLKDYDKYLNTYKEQFEIDWKKNIKEI